MEQEQERLSDEQVRERLAHTRPVESAGEQVEGMRSTADNRRRAKPPEGHVAGAVVADGVPSTANQIVPELGVPVARVEASERDGGGVELVAEGAAEKPDRSADAKPRPAARPAK